MATSTSNSTPIQTKSSWPYGRRALTKDAGASPDDTGSHRIIIGSKAGPFTDPDESTWEHA